MLKRQIKKLSLILAPGHLGSFIYLSLAPCGSAKFMLAALLFCFIKGRKFGMRAKSACCDDVHSGFHEDVVS